MEGFEQSTPTILILGTGHWSNPGVDYKSPEYDNMLAAGRQREIEECVQTLENRFVPNKVALEVQRQDEESLNKDYSAYRAGNFPLTANERHQIGFRLAAKLEHERIHAIDWHHPKRAIGWDDAISFAREHGQHHLISFFPKTFLLLKTKDRQAR